MSLAEGNRNGPLAALQTGRPLLYIVIVVIVASGAMIYKLRVSSIFACSAEGYAADRYLEYCQADGYGDYDHGAFVFALEPPAQDSARLADVLFLGNSRLQFALSANATDEWFASQSIRHYLLGFSYSDGHVFAQEVLRKLKPQAKVYIINMDGFFSTFVSDVAKPILSDPTTVERYENKRRWQSIHRPVCGLLPALCGREFTVFRVHETGRWIGIAGQFQGEMVTDDPMVDPQALQQQVAAGRYFLDRLTARRECVILTVIPTVQTPHAMAKAVSAGLKMELISPSMDGLQTFDGSHLDEQSAERWSKGFMDAAAPRITKCVSEPNDFNTVWSN
jgi:hypothetical protein